MRVVGKVIDLPEALWLDARAIHSPERAGSPPPPFSLPPFPGVDAGGSLSWILVTPGILFFFRPVGHIVGPLFRRCVCVPM